MSAAYCQLASAHPVHAGYHDFEYGFPSTDERVLFERLKLEINQAGLSWLTTLNKRAPFRAAFAEFDVDRVAAFGGDDVARLLSNPGIVRNRLKIEATIDNARRIRSCAIRTGRLRVGSRQVVPARRGSGPRSSARRSVSPVH